MRVTVDDIRRSKAAGRRVTMVTAYDRPTAALVDAAGVDIVLVGDSVGMVVLGLPTTRAVTMEMMITSAAAVRRGVERALLVVDLPHETLSGDAQRLCRDARRCVNEIGADAVKVEWSAGLPSAVRALVDAGIPVMGHVGLTPQAMTDPGQFRVQARTADAATVVVQSAVALEAAGCFSIVIECVPDHVAEHITGRLAIPTIGIGAGPDCDGQVLVLHDLLGLSGEFHPKFVRQYANVSTTIQEAVEAFCRDVRQGQFPSQAETYHMDPAERLRFDQLVTTRTG